MIRLTFGGLTNVLISDPVYPPHIINPLARMPFFQQEGNVILTVWKDKSQVSVLSTNSNAEMVAVGNPPKLKPSSIRHYNTDMSGLYLCFTHVTWLEKYLVERMVEMKGLLHNVMRRLKKTNLLINVHCILLVLQGSRNTQWNE